MAAISGTHARAWELIGLRLLILAMAAIAFYVGYGLLTSPLWLPLTIGIWLSAAVMVAIAVLAPAEVSAK